MRSVHFLPHLSLSLAMAFGPACGDDSAPRGAPDAVLDAGDEILVPPDIAAESDSVPGQDVAVDADADAAGPDSDALANADTAIEPDGATIADVTDTFDPGPDPCGEVDALPPQYATQVATWAAQDDLDPWPAGAVVFAGSSSIRRWEGLSAAYTDYAPIQRGIGGATLGEIAHHAETIVTRHDPRAVVVYAGTNDLTGGLPVDLVVERFQCLRYRIGQALGWDRPLVFIGVTPSPARWDGWDEARAFNDAIAAIAEDDTGVTFVDVAPAFLATGEPPADSLYVSDRLHLSPSGYDLWDRIIRAALVPVVPPNGPASSPGSSLSSGTRIMIDLGPSNAEDGQVTTSPDDRGQHWNNWHDVEGGVTVLGGERLGNLVTTWGNPSGIDLVIAGSFIGNGRVNGGLLAPSSSRLGNFAQGSATGDYFYVAGGDSPGALQLRGLDPAASYTLKFFAARDASEVRVTRYTAKGASTATTTLQTSGAGAGANGATTNDNSVATLARQRPDSWGNLFIDVDIETGTYAYISVIEITVD